MSSSFKNIHKMILPWRWIFSLAEGGQFDLSFGFFIYVGRKLKVHLNRNLKPDLRSDHVILSAEHLQDNDKVRIFDRVQCWSPFAILRREYSQDGQWCSFLFPHFFLFLENFDKCWSSLHWRNHHPWEQVEDFRVGNSTHHKIGITHLAFLILSPF